MKAITHGWSFSTIGTQVYAMYIILCVRWRSYNNGHSSHFTTKMLKFGSNSFGTAVASTFGAAMGNGFDKVLRGRPLGCARVQVVEPNLHSPG